jgi:hypothetical protein
MFREEIFVWRRLIILSEAVVLLGSTVQILADARNDRITKRRVAERLLGWSLPINGGLLEIAGFFSIILRREENTENSSLPEGDQLQSEVALAHLALGVLGVLSFRFRGMFWFATIIGQGIFLIGVGVVHAREVLKEKIFLFDALMALTHLTLLKAYNPMETRPRPLWQRILQR